MQNLSELSHFRFWHSCHDGCIHGCTYGLACTKTHKCNLLEACMYRTLQAVHEQTECKKVNSNNCLHFGVSVSSLGPGPAAALKAEARIELQPFNW